MSTMHARLDNQGTAIGESALCADCLSAHKVNPAFDTTDSVTGHEDCSGNEALTCCACGVGAPRAAYREFVRALFREEPARVEGTYAHLYADSFTWQAQTVQERVEGSIDLDSDDEDGSWAFQSEFDASFSGGAR